MLGSYLWFLWFILYLCVWVRVPMLGGVDVEKTTCLFGIPEWSDVFRCKERTPQGSALLGSFWLAGLNLSILHPTILEIYIPLILWRCYSMVPEGCSIPLLGCLAIVIFDILLTISCAIVPYSGLARLLYTFIHYTIFSRITSPQYVPFALKGGEAIQPALGYSRNILASNFLSPCGCLLPWLTSCDPCRSQCTNNNT